jgi:hypothetical protein
MASALLAASRQTPSASNKSPTIAVAPMELSEAAQSFDRVNATTWWPAVIAARRKCAPMKPVAPVTKILCGASKAKLKTSTRFAANVVHIHNLNMGYNAKHHGLH